MNQKNDMSDSDHIVYLLLENLKSNGTFDEFRRHCVSDIDAKPTFQNWKQRIETHVLKYLSKFKYTPELNKNTVRERLRKHIFDGRESHDIEEGADRILTQILAPRMCSTVFEPGISNAVDEYLGIKNEAPSIEQNGLKECNKNMKNISVVEVNSNVSNSKLDLTSDADNMDNIDEISPEFEPLSSVLDNDNSNDESVSGMSDLASVGSPVQLIPKENHDTNSNGFESDKNCIEKPQQIQFDTNGITNHKNDSTNIKSDDVSKIFNDTEKLKTNDSKPSKSKYSSKTSLHVNTQEKSSSHRSKDRNSSSHRSSSREKNDVKKRNSSSSKDRKSNHHSKHHSNSKDKKHKHDKKSHHGDRDKTPKRDRKDSRSDKKEKSSSLCKEPKSLNGNRSDDDNNAGGSSKQKSNLHKNKSSASDKSKSSSSNHKSSRKDNSSKEVVDKSKDKSSISKNSASQKSNQTDSKKQKRSLGEKYKLDTDNSNVEEKKPKLNDFRSSITNDDQDAANVLLSISEIPYESVHNDITTENIMLVENSSSIEIQKMSLNTTENELEISENSNQTKNIQSSNNDNVKENVNLKINNLETSQLDNSLDNLSEKNLFKLNHSFEKVCSVEVERYPLSCKDVKLQNSSIQNIDILEHNQLAETVNDKKEENSVDSKVNFNLNDIQITSEPDANQILKVPKLKLKRLLNQNDSIKIVKRKKHHKNNESKIKRIKPSKSYSLSSETSVPVIETTSITEVCKSNEQESNLDTDIKINDAVNTSSDELLYKENKNKSTSVMNDDNEYTFKGFPQTDYLFCLKYTQLKSVIKTLQEEIDSQKILESNGFKGFSCEDVHPCENRHIVHSHLIKLKEDLGFIGFSEEETEYRAAHKFVKEQLELAKKQDNIQQKTISCGGNGIQNGKKLNKVMEILYKSDKDNTTSDKVYDQTNVNNEKDCPAVNNNNHDITASDTWVVEQEMKYNLLPVKVKIERLLEYRCNNTKQVSNSPEVSNAPQRSKFK